MKKIYLDPEMEVIELEVASAILAGSIGDVDGGGADGEYTGGKSDTSSEDWGKDY